jgi:hypothetical protein
VDAVLAGKYDAEASILRALPEHAFMDRWRAASEEGATAAVLWAAATREDLSDLARREIFGSTHMAMHAGAHTVARLRQKLSAERAETKGLRRVLREVTSSCRRLERQQDVARARAAVADDGDRARPVGRASADAPSQALAVAGPRERALKKEERRKAWTRELEQRLVRAEEAVAGLTRRNAELVEALARARATSLDTVQHAADTLREALDQEQCSADCPQRDLCGQRVLIVGGIARMESRFRTMVEEFGGVCEHHDGRVGNGRRRLEGRVKRADLVICLSGVNSHAACEVVKDCGKRLGKPIHLLDGVSLSAVARVLEQSASA